MDFGGQVVIILFLIESDASLLMTVPSAVGALIALWKCQRGAGFKKACKVLSYTYHHLYKLNISALRFFGWITQNDSVMGGQSYAMGTTPYKGF